jgi:GMP synthase-like glutamine amidotransferase
VVELDKGEPMPSHISAYEALVVMGSPMDVWQEDAYPWLKAEKAAIRDWVVGRRRPGICLGHQLLAEALAKVQSVYPTIISQQGEEVRWRLPTL